jgi:hypothetical protein
VERLPDIGEGVLVPWGLDEVQGEVVDVIAPSHAVVRVSLGAEAGEDGDETVRLPISALQELPRWRPVGARRGAAAPGADAPRAFWITAQRDGEEAKVEVRISGSLAASQARLPREASEAIRTQGRSAVEKYSRQFRLPKTIVISTHGVFPSSS